MAIQLSSEQEVTINQILATGEYEGVDAVISAALRLLEERDRRLRWLRAEIQKGIDQADRGEVIEYTPQLFDQIEREVEENIRQGKPVRDAVE
jgi:putative addiction module CopG family antidote